MFQKSVSTQPAAAVAGDFASANPRASVLAGPGGLIAGPNGVTVGRFGWVSYAQLDVNGAGQIVNNTGAGIPTGFVHREQQALITTFLAESGMLIPSGYPMTLMDAGDYWVQNDGATEALPGMKAFASLATGQVSFAVAGSTVGGASGSTSSVAASTGSFTGSISGNVLTLTAISSGTAVPGGTISGTNVATGTKIVAQLTPLLGGETLGGVGRYTVSIPDQTVASTAISETYGTLTVAGTVAGTFGVGGVITGTGISVPTTITALGTGTGGAGTYIVDVNTVVSSTAITTTTFIETKYFARSAGPNGALVKISSLAY